jgi:shikimate dehydrogenase
VVVAQTKTLWLLGHPVAHSLSAVMYNAAFAHLGLDWHYEAIDVSSSDLAAAFARVRQQRIIGGNLTLPHKPAALALMDKVDSTARLCGAVNTFVAGGPKRSAARAGAFALLTGYNTDGHGLAAALRQEFGLELRGRTIVILGAGGAAQAAAMQCAMEGANTVFIVNRTAAKAQALAEKVCAQFPKTRAEAGIEWKAKAGSRAPKIDLVINATSLGLRPEDDAPIGRDRLAGVPFAYDMIYRRAETKFLRNAREAGARTANGLSMLLYQGARALELWLAAHVPDRPLRAPVEVMRAALQEAVSRQWRHLRL